MAADGVRLARRRPRRARALRLPISDGAGTLAGRQARAGKEFGGRHDPAHHRRDAGDRREDGGAGRERHRRWALRRRPEASRRSLLCDRSQRQPQHRRRQRRRRPQGGALSRGAGRFPAPHPRARKTGRGLTVAPALHAFGGYGIELEYAIVDGASLDPRPLAEPLLRALDGGRPKRIDGVDIDWSNEVVAHVVEIKNVAPVATLAPLVIAFRDGVTETNRRVGDFGALLMPTGMHPWMDPRTAELWTHSDGDIYRTFDRLFDCHRHGWANLQSMHINLPFAGDDEFARLHAAVRLVLPLIPALAASSPFADAQRMPFLDYRLAVYRTNADRIPTITGAVIPDNARDRADYQTGVLQPMYREIAADD